MYTVTLIIQDALEEDAQAEIFLTVDTIVDVDLGNEGIVGRIVDIQQSH